MVPDSTQTRTPTSALDVSPYTHVHYPAAQHHQIPSPWQETRLDVILTWISILISTWTVILIFEASRRQSLIPNQNRQYPLKTTNPDVASSTTFSSTLTAMSSTRRPRRRSAAYRSHRP